jgi:uncharacterized protein (DUF2461 family)
VPIAIATPMHKAATTASRFRVITVLERVIPLVKHLHDGAADANRQNRGDSEPSQFHRNASVTFSRRERPFTRGLRTAAL